MSYDTNMRGAYFKNKKKETDKHPDYRGSAIIDNVKYWVAVWVETSKESGERYFSVSYTKKDNQGDVSKPADKKPPDNDDFDDDIPF